MGESVCVVVVADVKEVQVAVALLVEVVRHIDAGTFCHLHIVLDCRPGVC